MALVRIRSSFILNDRFELPSEGLRKVVSGYRKAWQKKEKKIMTGLSKITGLAFFPNVIDCYITNAKKFSNISSPLIVGGGYKPQEFVHILTHELTHILAEDNKQGYNWHKAAEAAYSKLHKHVAHHVMTNAVFEALYTDVLHNTDVIIWATEHIHLFTRSDLHRSAWEVIEAEGYQNVLQKVTDKQVVAPQQFFSEE